MGPQSIMKASWTAHDHFWRFSRDIQGMKDADHLPQCVCVSVVCVCMCVGGCRQAGRDFHGESALLSKWRGTRESSGCRGACRARGGGEALLGTFYSDGWAVRWPLALSVALDQQHGRPWELVRHAELRGSLPFHKISRRSASPSVTNALHLQWKGLRKERCVIQGRGQRCRDRRRRTEDGLPRLWVWDQQAELD